MAKITVTKSVFWIVGAIALSGCGGDGGSSPVASVLRPKVKVNWPTVTRSFNAPVYAKSALIRLSRPGSTNDLVWSVDRPAGDSSNTATYLGPELSASGPVTLAVTFFSGTGASQQSVAQANISAFVDGSGNILDSEQKLLGAVTYGATMAGMALFPSTIRIGETQQWSVGFGTTNSNEIVALPTNAAVNLGITSGGEHVQISGRNMTGISEGNVQFSISVDGSLSTAQMMVLPVLRSASTITMEGVQSSVFDSARNLFWAADSNGNLLGLDATTGNISTTIALGQLGATLAISSDRNTLYVGTRSLAVIQVNLSTRQVVRSIQFTDSSFLTSPIAASISVNPSNGTQFAVVFRDQNSSATSGPFVWDGTSQFAGSSSFPSMVSWYDNDRIISVSNSLPAELADYQFDGTSLSFVKSVRQDYRAPISFGNQKLFSSNEIFDLRSWSVTNDLGAIPGERLASAIDSVTGALWVVGKPSIQSQNVLIRSLSGTNYSSRSVFEVAGLVVDTFDRIEDFEVRNGVITFRAKGKFYRFN